MNLWHSASQESCSGLRVGDRFGENQRVEGMKTSVLAGTAGDKGLDGAAQRGIAAYLGQQFVG